MISSYSGAAEREQARRSFDRVAVQARELEELLEHDRRQEEWRRRGALAINAEMERRVALRLMRTSRG